MNNGKRRRLAKATAHVAGAQPSLNPLGTRAARRTRKPRPKPMKPMSDRQKQYRRAAERAAK